MKYYLNDPLPLILWLWEFDDILFFVVSLILPKVTGLIIQKINPIPRPAIEIIIEVILYLIIVVMFIIIPLVVIILVVIKSVRQ